VYRLQSHLRIRLDSCLDGGKKLPKKSRKSKQEKTAGIEKHKQALREKKMKKKERKPQFPPTTEKNDCFSP
jgi:hypothetical protein